MAITIMDFAISLNDWVYIEDPIAFSSTVYDTTTSGINPLNTYYIFNDVILPTSVSGLGAGYYIIETFPLSVSGAVDLTLHISNYDAEALEENYSFLFGYHILYKDPNKDWGADKEILISAAATNTAICPNSERVTTYFTTKEYDHYDLASSIVPTGWANLGAEIKPQTMQYFYGHTYTVTVSGIKDYNGNQLPAFSWYFTIISN
ncbi:MAG TPA: hypothetical protein VI911_07895 [Patescibacteria group bacterium]|nr:hypothetical protein [Patescibacteria group bacterium]